MPSQKPDISKIILQNVLRKHIHVTSLTDNIQTNIKVMINTKWEQLAVELNWFIFVSVWCHPDVDGDCTDDVIRTRRRRHPCTRDILRMRAEDRGRTRPPHVLRGGQLCIKRFAVFLVIPSGDWKSKKLQFSCGVKSSLTPFSDRTLNRLDPPLDYQTYVKRTYLLRTFWW